MNPDTDIKIVVAGEAAQTAALLRSGQVDALSQFDTQYALTENAGAKLRLLDEANEAIAHFPSNGFVALEETLKNKRAAVGRARPGLCHGHACSRSPIRRRRSASCGRSFRRPRRPAKTRRPRCATTSKTLKARAANWQPEAGGVKKWGENSIENYNNYVDFLVENGVLKQKIDANDLVTNELIDDINKFDAAEVTKMAKDYKAK